MYTLCGVIEIITDKQTILEYSVRLVFFPLICYYAFCKICTSRTYIHESLSNLSCVMISVMLIFRLPGDSRQQAAGVRDDRLCSIPGEYLGWPHYQMSGEYQECIGGQSNPTLSKYNENCFCFTSKQINHSINKRVVYFT